MISYGICLALFGLELTLSLNSVKYSTDGSLLDVQPRDDVELLLSNIPENVPEYVLNEAVLPQ